MQVAESNTLSESRVFALVDGRKTPPLQVAEGQGTGHQHRLACSGGPI